jgi:hypothetical protein
MIYYSLNNIFNRMKLKLLCRMALQITKLQNFCEGFLGLKED